MGSRDSIGSGRNSVLGGMKKLGNQSMTSLPDIGGGRAGSQIGDSDRRQGGLMQFEGGGEEMQVLVDQTSDLNKIFCFGDN